MKFSAIASLVAFAAVQAAALPDAEALAQNEGHATGFCGAPGNPCYKVKRTAHAIAAAVSAAKPASDMRKRGLDAFCQTPGTDCTNAADAIDDILDVAGNTAEHVVKREADAEAEVRRRFGWCSVRGMACLKTRDAEPEAEAMADADADADADAKKKNKKKYWKPLVHKGSRRTRNEHMVRPSGGRITPVGRLGGLMGWCSVPGMSCLKTRDTEAEASGEAGAEARKRKSFGMGWCSVAGMACLKTRDAEADAEAGHRFGWCSVRGMACLKERDAIAEAEAQPEAGRRFGWCSVRGMACLKARDASAVATSISAADPDFFKRSCYEEGGECDTVLKIRDATLKVRRADEAAAAVEDPVTRLDHCDEDGADCTNETQQHQLAKKHNRRSADEAEAECYAPEGACTIAETQLKAIDEAVAAAVDTLDKE